MYQKVGCDKAMGLKSNEVHFYSKEEMNTLIKEYKELVQTLEKYYDSNKIVKVSFDESEQSIIERI